MKRVVFIALVVIIASSCKAQITDTRHSTYAVTSATPVDAVIWTGGFWGERFKVFSETSVQSMWETWQSDRSHGFHNFLVASGEKKGKHHGPPFHDGDI